MVDSVTIKILYCQSIASYYKYNLIVLLQDMMAEARLLRQHKGRLEARMQILEDHNRQLEAQLQRLRQLLDEVIFQFFSRSVINANRNDHTLFSAAWSKRFTGAHGNIADESRHRFPTSHRLSG